MALFQKSVLNKYLEGLDQDKVNAAYELFSAHFHNPTVQLNIRKAKEEQYQGGFLIDLFVKVLGYTKNPKPNFNLTTELKNVKGAKKADGAILVKGKAIAVIELKGMNTPNLDKIEGQAFGYKSNQPDAVYVITSNFEKLRFYIDNAVEFIEWNLFNLTKEQFNEVWLCLAKESILSGLPKQIKEESVIREKKVTEDLYRDYSTFRNELYNSISKKNPDIDPSLLFKKTQKLLDRFLFIFFAEDRLLVPPNSITRIIDRWKQLEELDNYKPLYVIFQQYFGYFNNGRKGKKSVDDIFAYNGGLFKPDAILDKLHIDDYILFKHTQKLTKYDFVSEVDVNILGHIFEHSLNDIEEINAQLEGEVLDKSKSKRKKDGVFYTPKYITKYIVENTVGKLCEEKKTELGIDDIDFSKTYLTKKKRTNKDGKKTFLSAEGEKILNGLTEYRKYLLGLTICDPACGSGAFLNQAFNYLIEEHENIDQYNASLRGDMLTLTDVSKDILENNLFGVDINNEAVEIAKLSLWLRTAQKGRKLNNLNENIKCGNSLIDDPEVAGEKAFNWETEFPEVFKNGGFDVVIGNPPYGALISENEKKLYQNKFKTFQGNFEIYFFFIELCKKLSKRNSRISYITPDTWINIPQAQKLREHVLKNYGINEILTFEHGVFQDASVNAIIFILSNEIFNGECKITNIDSKEFELSNVKFGKIELWKNSKDKQFQVWQNDKDISIIEKISQSSFPALNYLDVCQGIVPYSTEHLTKEEIKNKIYHSDSQINEEYGKWIQGRAINRYLIDLSNNTYLRYGEWLHRARKPKYFTNERILIQEITGGTPPRISSTIYSNKLYHDPGIISCLNISKLPTKYILAIINSKLISWFNLKTSPKGKRKTFPKVLIGDIRKFPIAESSKENQNSFITIVDDILKSNELFINKSNSFIRLIQRKLNLEKLSKKLQNWHTLTFGDFVKELKKKKIKLGLAEESEWEEYFETEKVKALEIKAVIDKTDKEIDQMVYGLYGLTEEEIRIVENS